MARKQSSLTKQANKARRDFEANATGQRRGTTATGQSPFQAMKAAQLAAEGEGSQGKEVDPRFAQTAQHFVQSVAAGGIDPAYRKKWLHEANTTRLAAEREGHGDVYRKAARSSFS